MTFQEFLFYLESEGVNAAIGVIWSILLELFPGWARVKPRVKRLFTMLLCFVIPLAAACIGAWMGYQSWGFEQTFWPALRAGFLAFWTSQGVHAFKMRN